MKSSIFHIRLTDFELQAERTLDAALRTRPVAIISSHHQDGTIVTASAEAREEGLIPGMKVSLARKMSHGVLLLPYNRALYARLNSYIYATVSTFAPVVEPAGFGQFFLDMTGMQTVYRNFLQTAETITRQISSQTTVKGSAAISVNKLVSRIATAVVPEPVFEVPCGNEARFLSPLNTPVLPSAHQAPVKKIIRFLYLNQVRHIQAVAADADSARILFGPFSGPLSREAHGQDTSAVRAPSLQDHLLEQWVLPDDTNDEALLRAVVGNLAEQIGFQLRQRGQTARDVRLEIHYTDGFRSARTGSFPANDNPTLARICLRLFKEANYRRNRVRAVLIDATRFQQYADQTNLFMTPDIRRLALSKALDTIRRKHGFARIQSAALLNLTAAPGPVHVYPS